MEIQFDLDNLQHLYWFKHKTIELCIQFIQDVIRGSHRSRIRQLQSKIKDIELDLYDLFCRWNFIALVTGNFNLQSFLPTEDFIIMKDLEYYLNRFGIHMQDSFVEFPKDAFLRILSEAPHQTRSVPKVSSLSATQRLRLESIYLGSNFEADATKLMTRYQYLGGLNNSLSVPPSILDLFPSHELFGTPLNTHTSFCSPFNDEKVFSSNGSFFTFEEYDEEKIYFANPPFDDAFCSLVATRLLKQLEKKLFHLIVIIPVWDTDQQKKHNLKDFGLAFDCYNRLVQSPYFIEDIFLGKEKFPFFNYFSQKNVYISNVHLINLGKKVDTAKIIEEWSKN
jgi:hypothetical protein